MPPRVQVQRNPDAFPTCACGTTLKFEVRNGRTYEWCPECHHARAVPRIVAPAVYVPKIRRSA